MDASRIAQDILQGFEAYYSEFNRIMARSKRRFETRDWSGLQADAQERLNLYVGAVDGMCVAVAAERAHCVQSPEFWEQARKFYEALSTDPANGDLARAYFNTIKRHFIPVDAQDFEPCHIEVPHAEHFKQEVWLVTSKSEPSVRSLLYAILNLFPFETPYADLAEDVHQAVQLLESRLVQAIQRRPVAILKPIFYRARRAHIIGRVWSDGQFIPLVLALTNGPQGLRLAEVLLGEEETSSLFSFTRSHFHVVTAHHRELMAFLRSLAPAKSPADLYASVGHHNLSKSALLADLFRLAKQAGEQFRATPGISGTVMFACELPGSRFVIKLIRDEFLTRRVDTTPEKVRRRYAFVQHAERAGRILDIAHFQHVRFERGWFQESLLQSLLRAAPSQVILSKDSVILQDFYAQRKVVPLDVFFRSSIEPSILRRVVIDVGFLHKELAQRNIFTGDVVPNNFGVVSIGRRDMRVVSFDYDGYSRVTDMRFLGMVQTDDDTWDMPEDRMVLDEEWDVLPEKFRVTLGIPAAHREEFERVHAELFEVTYWAQLQATLQDRPEMVTAFPYPLIARET